MNITWDIHTGGYTTLDQGVVYDEDLRAVGYRCASCGELHPWDERLRDPETGLYHGIDCEGADYLALVARQGAERGRATAASNRGRARRATATPAAPTVPGRRFVEAWER